MKIEKVYEQLQELIDEVDSTIKIINLPEQNLLNAEAMIKASLMIIANLLECTKDLNQRVKLLEASND